MEKIKIINSNSNTNIKQKFYGVRIFSRSHEAKLFKKLSEKKNKYFDEETERKIFNEYELFDSSESTEPSLLSDKYLKNKYLYLTTRGVVNYLRLYESQKEDTNKDFYSCEIDTLKKIIELVIKDKSSLSIISLGAANSDKEICVFNQLSDDNIRKLSYFPVDISDYLIHLGIIDFSSSTKLEKLKVHSIISDFWDLAEYIIADIDSRSETEKRLEIFQEEKQSKKIFTMLGGTFGNYTEKELLDQVIEMMEVDDELLISVKLKEDQTEKDLHKEYANQPGNSEFLMEPLTYIPYYYGYARYKRDLLKTDETALLTDSNEGQKKFVSIIPKSICHAPYIEVEEKNHSDVKKLRLAWTTRYDLSELKKWIQNDYTSSGKCVGKYKFDFCKDSRGNGAIYPESPKGFAILHIKKSFNSFNNNIRKLLLDNNIVDAGLLNSIKNIRLESTCDIYYKLQKVDFYESEAHKKILKIIQNEAES